MARKRNIILDALEPPDDGEHRASDGPIGEPPERGPKRRGLKRSERTDEKREYVTVEQARQQFEQAAQAYLKSEPSCVLVAALPPGAGKTYIGVKLAEQAALAGRRVLYLGPRHDFFADVRAASAAVGQVLPELFDRWWYEWLPRQEDDPELGKYGTCHYSAEIKLWQDRKYQSMDFCSRICGWQYVSDGCIYHRQKLVRQPIIFGQHAHLIAHPLLEQIDLIIGDENPMSAFLHHWIIPGRFVVPPDMAIDDPLTELVHELAGAIDRGNKADGIDLLNILGGATHVREACEAAQLDTSIAAYAPQLRNAGQVNEAPYFHLPNLVSLLFREAQAAEAGRAYPARVAIANGKLHLLLRHDVSAHARGKHIMWLDATANEHLYRQMFGQTIEIVQPHIRLAGRVYQVWPRANGKTFLIKDNKLTSKVEQLAKQVERIIEKHSYQRPAIITFEALKSLFDAEMGHFYGARGTNRFEGCDALIVAGTPQPDLGAITKQARMIYQDRMQPFDMTWSERDVQYAGQGYSYPVSGFWHDPDLNALLWQFREAELIQAAHRARPILHDVDIWLLTNIPMDELPPDELLDIKALFDAPMGVDPYRWPDVMAIADEFERDGHPMRAADLVERINIDKKTAQGYLQRLTEQYPDRWKIDTIVPTSKGGKPARALFPKRLGE